MRTPGLRGIDVVEALARDGSATRVLVLSAAPASAVVYAAGAAGYWSKDAERGAIAAVVRGEKVLNPRPQSGVTEIHAREVDGERRVLTSRER